MLGANEGLLKINQRKLGKCLLVLAQCGGGCQAALDSLWDMEPGRAGQEGGREPPSDVLRVLRGEQYICVVSFIPALLRASEAA